MSDLSSLDSTGGSGERSSNDSWQMGHQMTIFYDDKIGAYDVTEHQARAILLLASHVTEQRMCKEDMTLAASFRQRLCSPVNGVSTKASLQRFLQKRKLRAQARLPY